jgi:hypothetical protein
MNPSKRDAWPPWRDVRFVLVRSPGRLRPCRGLVLDWSYDRARPRARRWRAFVVYLDDVALQQGPRLAWLEVDQLIPVQVDPNLAAPNPHALQRPERAAWPSEPAVRWGPEASG